MIKFILTNLLFKLPTKKNYKKLYIEKKIKEIEEENIKRDIEIHKRQLRIMLKEKNINL